MANEKSATSGARWRQHDLCLQLLVPAVTVRADRAVAGAQVLSTRMKGWAFH